MRWGIKDKDELRINACAFSKLARRKIIEYRDGEVCACVCSLSTSLYPLSFLCARGNTQHSL